jgi:uncharacterized protein
MRPVVPPNHIGRRHFKAGCLRSQQANTQVYMILMSPAGSSPTESRLIIRKMPLELPPCTARTASLGGLAERSPGPSILLPRPCRNTELHMLRDYVILCFAAAAGGAVNSVAGGGTLLTFPALFSLLAASTGSMASASVVANATSTVALVPGAIAAVWGYRQEVRAAPRWTYWLLGPSVLGGLAGAWLLTVQRPEAFLALVPWLILGAALLFALQPTIARRVGIGRPHAPTRNVVCAIVVFQFVVAIYGGYFGAGLGILMLSALAMIGLTDIHIMNGLKSLYGSCINGVAVAVFVIQGKVNWPLALLMAASAIVGGYAGARVARRLNRDLVRRSVVAIGVVLAAYYFYRQFAA